jgi:hypothetical protein
MVRIHRVFLRVQQLHKGEHQGLKIPRLVQLISKEEVQVTVEVIEEQILSQIQQEVGHEIVQQLLREQ